MGYDEYCAEGNSILLFFRKPLRKQISCAQLDLPPIVSLGSLYSRDTTNRMASGPNVWSLVWLAEVLEDRQTFLAGNRTLNTFHAAVFRRSLARYYVGK